ncbi:hypothetical protein HK405_004905, partial [Cladochytrium tenue]
MAATSDHLPHTLEGLHGWADGGNGFNGYFPPPSSTSTSLPQAAEHAYAENWPRLASFVRCALELDRQHSSSLATFSHEDLYRRVYQLCRTPALRTRLRDDLAAIVARTLDSLLPTLDPRRTAGNLSISPRDWLDALARVLIQALRAAQLVRDVFAYLETSLLRVPGPPSSEPNLAAPVRNDIRRLVLDAVRDHLLLPLQPPLAAALHSVDDVAAGAGATADLLRALLTVSP